MYLNLSTHAVKYSLKHFANNSFMPFWHASNKMLKCVCIYMRSMCACIHNQSTCPISYHIFAYY